MRDAGMPGRQVGVDTWRGWHLNVGLALCVGVVLRVLCELLGDDKLLELDAPLRHGLVHLAQQLVHSLHDVLLVSPRQDLREACLPDVSAELAPVTAHDVNALRLQDL